MGRPCTFWPWDDGVNSRHEPRRPDYADYVRAIFDRAPFIRDLGVELIAKMMATIAVVPADRTRR
ncbi:MAG TPA: hypothetical protein VK540_19750 [Polyangiaceae bacterium]|nr:hypothetical protein [Polyangiaceae bacterium]